jgi:hypothetical protein
VAHDEIGDEVMTQTNPETEPSSTVERPDAGPSRSRVRALVALGAGLSAAALITAIVLVAEDGGGTTTDGSSSGSHQRTAAGNGSGTGEKPAGIEMHDASFAPGTPSAVMYYLGPESAATGQVYLFAEPHSVEQVSPQAAVHEFLTSYPLDSDYRSGWPQGVDVAGITTTNGETTIALVGDADLSSAGGLDEQTASTAVQGLIRTAGMAAGTVTFVYNDEPLPRLLGQDVRQGVEVLPDQSSNFAVTTRAAIQVTSPVEGQTMTNPVVIEGDGNVFEGTVSWQLMDSQGRELDSGFVTTAMGSWKDFQVDLGDLEPGDYTFRALEYSAEDGSEINVDDKSFTVE